MDVYNNTKFGSHNESKCDKQVKVWDPLTIVDFRLLVSLAFKMLVNLNFLILQPSYDFNIDSKFYVWKSKQLFTLLVQFTSS